MRDYPGGVQGDHWNAAQFCALQDWSLNLPCQVFISFQPLLSVCQLVSVQAAVLLQTMDMPSGN
jgi:hypothetical protein